MLKDRNLVRFVLTMSHFGLPTSPIRSGAIPSISKTVVVVVFVVAMVVLLIYSYKRRILII